MITRGNDVKKVLTVLLIIACFAVAFMLPEWKSDLQAQYYATEVAVDIKPGSCPNPININELGVLPVAILGTDMLDVNQIDPATIRLEGVAPIRWDIDDVAEPYYPLIGKYDAYDCTKKKKDRYDDLSLKFNVLDIVVAALADVNDGDVLVLQVTANLKAEFGGDQIVGEDIVIIRSN